MASVTIDSRLATRPEIFDLADTLDITRWEVIARLLPLWMWASEHEVTELTGTSAGMVAQLTGWKIDEAEDFRRILIECGILELTDSGRVTFGLMDYLGFGPRM